MNKLKWRYSHERNRNNKLRHAHIRQRRVVSADHGKRIAACGCDSEGERNTKGANEMRQQFENVFSFLDEIGKEIDKKHKRNPPESLVDESLKPFM